jgi:hypothetical protein
LAQRRRVGEKKKRRLDFVLGFSLLRFFLPKKRNEVGYRAKPYTITNWINTMKENGNAE